MLSIVGVGFGESGERVEIGSFGGTCLSPIFLLVEEENPGCCLRSRNVIAAHGQVNIVFRASPFHLHPEEKRQERHRTNAISFLPDRVLVWVEIPGNYGAK